jgi:hypothetical protein
MAVTSFYVPRQRNCTRNLVHGANYGKLKNGHGAYWAENKSNKLKSAVFNPALHTFTPAAK